MRAGGLNLALGAAPLLRWAANYSTSPAAYLDTTFFLTRKLKKFAIVGVPA